MKLRTRARHWKDNTKFTSFKKRKNDTKKTKKKKHTHTKKRKKRLKTTKNKLQNVQNKGFFWDKKKTKNGSHHGKTKEETRKNTGKRWKYGTRSRCFFRFFRVVKLSLGVTLFIHTLVFFSFQKIFVATSVRPRTVVLIVRVNCRVRSGRQVVLLLFLH